MTRRDQLRCRKSVAASALALGITIGSLMPAGCGRTKTPVIVPPTPPPHVSAPTLDSAARLALAELKSLAGVMKDTLFGLSTPTDIAGAVVNNASEPPIPIHIIPLDTLRMDLSGRITNPPLGEAVQYLYPVLVSGEVRTGMLFERDSVYRIVGYGGMHLTKDLVQARRRFALDHGVTDLATLAVVRIPSFNLFLVAGKVDGFIRLATVYPDPNLEATPQLSDTTAVTLLAALRSAANDHDSLPR